MSEKASLFQQEAPEMAEKRKKRYVQPPEDPTSDELRQTAHTLFRKLRADKAKSEDRRERNERE